MAETRALVEAASLPTPVAERISPKTLMGVRIDLQSVNVELDEEDRELLAMFPRRRECNLNDMVLTERKSLLPWGKERYYLEHKADIARRRKVQREALRVAVVIIACICLWRSITGTLTGTGKPLAWLVGFEGTIIPALLQRVRVWLR